MLAKLTVLLLLMLMFPFQLAAKALPNDWQLVGSAHLKVLWFDIYKARLFTASGRFETVADPLILQLNYLRDIDRKALLSETNKELRRFLSAQRAQFWVSQLADIFVDIKRGDQLSFWIDRHSHGHFFIKGRWIGSIEEPEFSHNFVRIWLAENSRYPKLAKQLKGGSSDGKSTSDKGDAQNTKRKENN